MADFLRRWRASESVTPDETDAWWRADHWGRHPEAYAARGSSSVSTAARAVFDWAADSLLAQSAAGGGQFVMRRLRGSAESLESIVTALESSGGSVMITSDDLHGEDQERPGDDDEERKTGVRCAVVSGPHAVAVVSWEPGDRGTTVSMVSLTTQLADHVWSAVMSAFAIAPRPERQKGGRPLYALTQDDEGLHLSEVAFVRAPIIEANYPPEVVRGFNNAVGNIRSPSPHGRLAIVSGDPGTGKTNLLKALVTALPDALCVLVPPDCLAELASPRFLDMLLRMRRRLRSSDEPVVFLVEEADRVIAERGPDNLAHLHGLLSIGDGLVGDALRAFAVVTTNGSVGPGRGTRIDKAVERTGRLMAHIRTVSLTAEQATEALRRLVPGTAVRSLSATLAEVYHRARSLGWSDESQLTPTT